MRFGRNFLQIGFWGLGLVGLVGLLLLFVPLGLTGFGWFIWLVVVPFYGMIACIAVGLTMVAIGAIGRFANRFANPSS